MLSFQRAAAMIAASSLAFPANICAHGIAGNRFFPGTMAIDDPAVGDELGIPGFSKIHHALRDGSDDLDTSMPGSVSRLLTPGLAVTADSSWVWHKQAGIPQKTGFGATHLGIKRLLYRNEPHELLASTAMNWGIRGIGSPSLHAHNTHALEPELAFGKGMGDLPDRLRWLRPFAVAGAIVPEFSTERANNTNILRWGLALEFSTLYCTNRFIPGVLPKEEPLKQFVPLIEFSFASPLNRSAGPYTTGTMNPGLAYVRETWQLAAEAIMPLNSRTGRSAGVLIQMLFFLDDLLPSLFGKPIFRVLRDGPTEPDLGR